MKNLKIINDPNEFFEYWVKNAEDQSFKARHKIMSQALSLFNINHDKQELNENDSSKWASTFFGCLFKFDENTQEVIMGYNYIL